MTFFVPHDGARLDVIEVGVHIQLQPRAQTQLQHRLDPDARLQADLDADAHFGLFLAARARDESPVAEVG